MLYEGEIKLNTFNSFGSRYLIEVPQAGPVGWIILHPPYLTYQELGWGCSFHQRNKGYTSRGIVEVLKDLRLRIPNKTLCATIHVSNVSSVKTALKAGLKQLPIPSDFKSRWTTIHSDILYFQEV